MDNICISNEVEITIKSDTNLNKIFFNKTNNRKYKFEYLLNSIIYILKTGISYRGFITLLYFININNNINIKLPDHTTIYKFLLKLIKYNIFKLTYMRLLNKYIINNNTNTNKYYTDTCLIPNKLGKDKIALNVQLLKHKTTKLSIITDPKGIPIHVDLYKSNIHDSKIFIDQLNNIIKENIIKKDNKNTFIGDGAYDSSIIKTKLKELNLGFLVTNKNKRNTKNKEIIDNLKLDDNEKELLKERYIVEHVNNRFKQFKRINIRCQK